MAPTNNRGGKTKHMKKSGKEDQVDAPKKAINLSELPVPADYDPKDGVWIGVVTKMHNITDFHARRVTKEAVHEAESFVHRRKGKLPFNNSRTKISLGTLLLCAERSYVSSDKKASDVIHIYDSIDQINYLKHSLGVIHPHYEAFVDENLKAKLLMDGSAGADSSKVDTGFDFGDKIDDDAFAKI